MSEKLDFETIVQLAKKEAIVVVTRNDVDHLWQLRAPDGESECDSVVAGKTTSEMGVMAGSIKMEDVQSGEITVRLATEKETENFETEQTARGDQLDIVLREFVES
ncbi:MAG: hypothetical protein ABIH35_01845 [Patescibacteria group bacterium]